MSRVTVVLAGVLVLAGAGAGWFWFEQKRTVWVEQAQLRAANQRRQEEEARYLAELPPGVREGMMSHGGTRMPAPMKIAPVLTSPVFSTDGRFLAAVRDGAQTDELVIWSASGGAPLLKRSEGYAYYKPQWASPTVLSISPHEGSFNFTKSSGKWELKSYDYRSDPFLGLTAPLGGDMSQAAVKVFPAAEVALWDFSGVSAENPNSLRMVRLRTREPLRVPAQLASSYNWRSLHVISPARPRGALLLCQWKSGEYDNGTGQRQSSLEVWDSQSGRLRWRRNFNTSSGQMMANSKRRQIVLLGLPRRAPKPKNVVVIGGPGKAPSEYFEYDAAQVLDAQTGKIRAQHSDSRLKNGVLSPDGTVLLCKTSEAFPVPGKGPQNVSHIVLYWFSLPEFRAVKRIAIPQGRSTWDPQFAFSPDGRQVAMTGGERIRVFNWRQVNSNVEPFKALNLF